MSMVEDLCKQLGGRIVSDGNVILIRCKYCPDSLNPNHAHFYLYPYNDTYAYHCKKCDTSGIVTKNKLLDWGIRDFSVLKNIKTNGIPNDIRKPVLNINNKDNGNSNFKLNYINSRLGTNLTLSDLASNKIVTSLKRTLEFNNIKGFTRTEAQVDILNKYYVGFISHDNTIINFRDTVDNNSRRRYDKYRVYVKHESDGYIYILPTSLDITKRTRIHIAEGPFDILSIKYNIVEPDKNYNDIFISISGIGYLNGIKFAMQKIGLINPIANIYFDNGINDYIYKSLTNKLRLLRLREVYYIHNTKSKDYGVPKNEIELKKEKIIIT